MENRTLTITHEQILCKQWKQYVFFFLNKCWIGLYSNSSTVIECSSCSCSEREKAYTTKHAKWWHTLEEKGRDEKRCIKEKESCKYSDIERRERIVAYMCVCVCVCVCVCIYMYIEREYIHCINIYIYIISNKYPFTLCKRICYHLPSWRYHSWEAFAQIPALGSWASQRSSLLRT